jgi:hypothetical protein
MAGGRHVSSAVSFNPRALGMLSMRALVVVLPAHDRRVLIVCRIDDHSARIDDHLNDDGNGDA